MRKYTVVLKGVHRGLICGVVLVTVLIQSSMAEDIRAPDFLGLIPFDTTTQLETSAGKLPDALFPTDPILMPLHDGWTSLTDWTSQFGLNLGIAYTSLAQKSTHAQKQRYGAGGDFDFFGRWNFNEPESTFPAAIVFKVENRHSYGQFPPASLSGSIGSLFSTSVFF
jgi:hypothetical protein